MYIPPIINRPRRSVDFVVSVLACAKRTVFCPFTRSYVLVCLRVSLSACLTACVPPVNDGASGGEGGSTGGGGSTGATNGGESTGGGAKDEGRWTDDSGCCGAIAGGTGGGA